MKSFYLLLCLTLPVSAGGIKLADPDIPDGETCVYSVDIDGERSEMTETVKHGSRNGRPYYIHTSRSVIEDRTAFQDRADMCVDSLDRVQKNGRAHVRRQVSLQKITVPPDDDEAGLIDFRALPYLLRSFPFGQRESINIRMFGGGNAFPMTAEIQKRETITAGGKTYDCYKISVGISGLMGKLLPKSHSWYDVAKPHRMIRYEGSVSGPGSPDMTVELKSCTP